MKLNDSTFVIDLFDEPPALVPKIEPASLGHNGNSGNGSAELEIRLRELEQAKKDLNTENADRRRVNNELKGALDEQKKQIEAVKSRAMRSEAKAALSEKGVIHKDVVDLFLKVAADKVKVDDAFEVQGIDDALAEFAKTHAVFFKAPPIAETDAEKTAREKAEAEAAAIEAEKNRKNRTAIGSSVSGGSADTSTNKADPNDKRTSTEMLAEYKRSMRKR